MVTVAIYERPCRLHGGSGADRELTAVQLRAYLRLREEKKYGTDGYEERYRYGAKEPSKGVIELHKPYYFRSE